MEKVLLSLWVFMNLILLYISGYMEKALISSRKLPFADWSVLTQYSDKFFPIDTKDLQHYDITEFLVYVIISLLLYRLLKSLLA